MLVGCPLSGATGEEGNERGGYELCATRGMAKRGGEPVIVGLSASQSHGRRGELKGMVVGSPPCAGKRSMRGGRAGIDECCWVPRFRERGVKGVVLGSPRFAPHSKLGGDRRSVGALSTWWSKRRGGE